jgi:hypothetical protein
MLGALRRPNVRHEDPSCRYELIDGFLLVTPATGVIHRILTTRLVAVEVWHLGDE